MAEKRTLLTKEYLQFLGVKDVKEDGTVIGASGHPIATRDNGNKYKVMGFNRAELGKPFNIYIHHIVWTWFKGKLEADSDVHHIDKNPANNALSNLQAMSHSEHLRLHKLERTTESTKILKCKMNKPRSFYEDLLTKYEAEYLKAPELYGKSTDPRYKRVVANISNTKARLRYWDAHKNEYYYKEEILVKPKEKTEYKRDLEELKYWKQRFREADNKEMWHQCCKVEKLAKTSPFGIDEAQKIVAHALEVIHRTFG